MDKYVQSVRRTETESRADWKSAILALSMLRGYTLVYDEFTRASPEANSALLSVIEEGVLVATDRASDRSYITAHPDFRIILTSNPHDYAGVKNALDALMDRVVTFALDEPPVEQLIGIVETRTGLDPVTSARIGHMVQALHRARPDAPHGVSTLRTAVMVARIAVHRIRTSRLTDQDLVSIACQVLGGRGIDVARSRMEDLLGMVPEPIKEAAP